MSIGNIAKKLVDRDCPGPIEGEHVAAKARRILEGQPVVTLEEGIRASVAWLTYVGLRDGRSVMGCVASEVR